MEEALPSLSSGVVGSRFVSSDDIETAKAKRDEQWKAAYARSEHCSCDHFSSAEYPPDWVRNHLHGQSRTRMTAAVLLK
jgi:hypothetical protein